ncbi:MAG: hypothetical protein FWE36_02940 [Erysipelotrichales bacterium]|nr:hypothetical protein [Erysipelotrichales bacterium]
MKAFIKWCEDKDNLIIKIILAAFLGIFWTIYRFVKSVQQDNLLCAVLAVILFILGGFFWLIILDIVSLILYRKVLWFC